MNWLKFRRGYSMEADEELERIRQSRLRKLKEKINETDKKNESAPNKPVTVTNLTFQDTIKKNLLVVVDCWAPWCGPCHMIAPMIDEMASDYSGKILFGKMNVDENPDIAVQYQIMSIPTLLIFKNGKLVDRIIGVMPKPSLEKKITSHL
jgi:thioredoxin 1